ncbi:MAG: MFS transporter [Spirochaetaceae bacterium]|jgi:fucose permease|nr:MFS transporter [Spirochaetaceae bacterium]
MLLLIIIYLSFISLGLPDSLLGSAWPSMYRGLNAPLHYAGAVFMIIAGGTVLSSILSEKIIRRFGTGAVTAASVLMTAAALIGFSFSHSFWLLCLYAVPLGLGGGTVDVALNNYVAAHYKARHMSWLHCFWGIGASLGPIIMSRFLMNGGSWNAGYRTIGIMQFCLVALLCVSLPLWKGKDKSAATDAAGHLSPGFKKLFRLPGVKQALVAFFCYCAIETTTGLWSSSYLVTVKNIPPETAAQWSALFYIGITFGRFISGFATILFSNRQMIRIGQIIIGGGILVLMLPLGRGALLPGLFMVGLGCAPVYPSLLHETPKNFGSAYSQSVMGIQMACAYIGTTLMPPIFGRLASYMSFSILPLFLGIILIIKIVMVETLYRKTAPNNKETPV